MRTLWTDSYIKQRGGAARPKPQTLPNGGFGSTPSAPAGIPRAPVAPASSNGTGRVAPPPPSRSAAPPPPPPPAAAPEVDKYKA